MTLERAQRPLSLERAQRSLSLERSADALGEGKPFVYKRFPSPKPPPFQKTCIGFAVKLTVTAPVVRFVQICHKGSQKPQSITKRTALYKLHGAVLCISDVSYNRSRNCQIQLRSQYSFFGRVGVWGRLPSGGEEPFLPRKGSFSPCVSPSGETRFSSVSDSLCLSRASI